jgi:Tfp pilus assembly protein PilE
MTARTRNTIIVAVAVIGVCGLFVFGVLAGAAVVGYRKAIQVGNGTATLQNIKTIAAVEFQYFNTHNRTFGTMEQLIHEQQLSSKFSGHPAVADGYVFTLTLASKSDGSSWYKITADPQDQSSGTNHFYLDSDDHLIRVNAERQAGPSDPDM